HRLLQNPKELAKMYPPFAKYDLPSTRIIESPFFKGKSESPPLQIADTCAFFIMHRLRRDRATQEFFELLSPQLTVITPGFGEKMGTEKLAADNGFESLIKILLVVARTYELGGFKEPLGLFWVVSRGFALWR